MFHICQTGYDTHQRQHWRHAALLNELGSALQRFREMLQSNGMWQHTVVATVSDFGRGAIENGSGGTDHGASTVQLVMGGRIPGGLYGAMPSVERAWVEHPAISLEAYLQSVLRLTEAGRTLRV